MMFFPAFLNLRDKPCLVVGGGPAAVAKARLLLAAQADVAVVDAAPSSAMEGLVGPTLRIERRDFRAADVAGRAAVIAASGKEAVDRRVARAAKDAGVAVNVVDNVALSTFIVPAIVDRDPIVVGIASGGAAPLLARRIREQIEAALPARMGKLARFAGRFRHAVKAIAPDAGRRRRFWDEFFDGPIAEMVVDGRDRAARDAMLALVNGGRGPVAGSVAIVGAGPGDPDLLTLKALRALQTADVIVYDRLVGPAILDLARRDAEKIYVGKTSGAHALSQDRINALLAERARAGHRVVRLKGGDPTIFGRGGEEHDYLVSHGIDVTIVPGITAAIAAAASARIPLTHRNVAPAVTFVTGHRRHDGSDIDWAGLARLDHTVVVYMGLGNASRIADALVVGGLAPTTPVAIVENATLPDEKIIAGEVAGLAAVVSAHNLRGPALIIIGEVAASAVACRNLVRDMDLQEIAA